MNQLYINLDHCYGIGKLDQKIEFGRKKACVIYAPNGTMKTSLTETIKDLIAGKAPNDRVFTERVSKAEIKIDNNNISKENCYVFDNNKEDGSKSISKFLANKELKDQFDKINSNIESNWKDLRNKLGQLGGVSGATIEEEIKKAFSKGGSFRYDILQKIYGERFKNDNVDYPLYTFKYKDVFDSAGRVEKFVNQNKDKIKEYFDKYSELIGNSSFFSSGKNSFGTFHAQKLLNAVKDNRFFSASHTIELRNKKRISTKKELSDLIEAEMNRILSDDYLKKSFEKIEKELGREDLATFKGVILNDKTLVAELNDYDEFRRKVLLGYLQKNIDEYRNFVADYNKQKEQRVEIIEKANKSVGTWEEIIELFQSRFYVPYKVKLANKSDIILKDKTVPTIEFEYHEGEDHTQESQEELLKVLSEGEKRAFHLLQNLFEIEAIKKTGKETLIVMDDVVDSFDYKNKYAFVEYLADLKECNNLYMLILTHNFDFYRSVVSRLNVSNIYFTSRCDDGNIKLSKGIYNPDIIHHLFIERIKGNKARLFIGFIPFVRNIIEYTKGDKDKGYMLLTECLHIKKGKKGIKMGEICEVFNENILELKCLTVNFKEKDYLSMLYEEADKIARDSDFNETDLAGKMVLSIATRLKAETFMWCALSDEERKEVKQNNNQTGELVKALKKHYQGKLNENTRLMDEVLINTSENIHFNNFMFEPLVDVSCLHLKDIYIKVSKSV